MSGLQLFNVTFLVSLQILGWFFSFIRYFMTNKLKDFSTGFLRILILDPKADLVLL